jgi:hypothetical protein
MPSTHTAARPSTPSATSVASRLSEVCVASGAVLIWPEPVCAAPPPLGT